MKQIFEKSDLLAALARYARVAENEIELSANMPEVVATTTRVARPARTGRLRGSKNGPDKRQTRMALDLAPADPSEA